MTRDEILARFDLTDRTALVTGGTRGIGRGIAEALSAAGANVVVASRSAEACEATAAAIEAAGRRAIGVPTHLGDLDQLGPLIAATVAQFGGLDILVNNAATALAQPMGGITPEAFDKSHGVNLRGPVFLYQHALPHLRASPHASVVNVITVGVFTHGGGVSLYTSAKAALRQMTRAMAAEGAADGIRVNALAPGPIDTDMTRATGDAGMDAMAAATLLKRMGRVDEIVGGALFLASDASSYMTGQELVIDGGLSLH